MNRNIHAVKQSTLIGDYLNMMTINFNFDFDIKLLNSMDTQKHGNKENLSIKKASL